MNKKVFTRAFIPLLLVAAAARCHTEFDEEYAPEIWGDPCANGEGELEDWDDDDEGEGWHRRHGKHGHGRGDRCGCGSESPAPSPSADAGVPSASPDASQPAPAADAGTSAGTPDAGPPPPECSSDAECAEGRVCSERGTCVDAECRDLLTEPLCIARPDCQPIYGGMNCTDPQGGECRSGDTDCVCETYSFAVCGPRL